MGANNLNDRFEEIEALVKEAQEGSHEAFAKIYDIFIDPIYRYVFFRVKDEDAEDIVETVFLKVWEKMRSYRRQKSSFSAWIFRIAHNLVVDHYRTSKDSLVSELDPMIPDIKREHSPIQVTERNIDKSVLKIALNKLKKPYQDIIVCKFIDELSNQEISQIFNKSEGSIRILQFRALKALKKELRDMGADYKF